MTLRAWVSVAPGQTLRYIWSASAGSVGASGREVRWDLTGLSAGIYTADVKVDGGSDAAGMCSVRVVVTDANRGQSVDREAGRTYLLKGEHEAAGYGLYSYLLLGGHPTAGTIERDRRIVQAYLGMIDDVVGFEKQLRGRLNVTYLPLETTAPKTADAAWVLEHYDYVRARVLLDLLPGSRKSGIYLVSSLRPLSDGPNPPYLFQDLSTIPPQPPDLTSWWINEFLNQAAQEKFWEPRTGELFVLKMRTTIAVLAGGLPEIQHALDGWISWVK